MPPKARPPHCNTGVGGQGLTTLGLLVSNRFAIAGDTTNCLQFPMQWFRLEWTGLQPLQTSVMTAYACCPGPKSMTALELHTDSSERGGPCQAFRVFSEVIYSTVSGTTKL